MNGPMKPAVAQSPLFATGVSKMSPAQQIMAELTVKTSKLCSDRKMAAASFHPGDSASDVDGGPELLQGPLH